MTAIACVHMVPDIQHCGVGATGNGRQSIAVSDENEIMYSFKL